MQKRIPNKRPRPIQQCTPNLDPCKPHANKADVAAHFGVTVRTVETWLADNAIPYYRRGRTIRFKIAELEQHSKHGKAETSY